MSGLKEKEGKKWKEKEDSSKSHRISTPGSISSQGSSSLRRPRGRSGGKTTEIETILADSQESVSPIRPREGRRGSWKPKTHFKSKVDYNDLRTATTSPFNTRSPTYPFYENVYIIQRADGASDVTVNKPQSSVPPTPPPLPAAPVPYNAPPPRPAKPLRPIPRSSPTTPPSTSTSSTGAPPAASASPPTAAPPSNGAPAKPEGNVCDVPACPVVKKMKNKEKMCKTDECPTVIKKKVVKEHKRAENKSCGKKNPLAMLGEAVMNAFTDKDGPCKLTKEEKKCWRKMKNTDDSCDDEIVDLDTASCGGKPKARKTKEVQCKPPAEMDDKANGCGGGSPEKVAKSTTCEVAECPVSAKKKKIKEYIDKGSPSGYDANDKQEVLGYPRKEKKCGTPKSRGCPSEQCAMKEKDEEYFNKCVGPEIKEKCPRLQMTCEEAQSGSPASPEPESPPAAEPPPPPPPPPEPSSKKPPTTPPKSRYKVLNVHVPPPINNPFLSMMPDVQVYPINTADVARRKSRERRESYQQSDPQSRIPIGVVVGSYNVDSSISGTKKESSPLVDNEDRIPSAKADNPKFSNIFIDEKDSPVSKDVLPASRSANQTDLHETPKSVLPKMSEKSPTDDAVTRHQGMPPGTRPESHESAQPKSETLHNTDDTSPTDTAKPPKMPGKTETQKSIPLKDGDVLPEPVPEKEISTTAPVESAMSKRLSKIRRRISNTTKDADGSPEPVPKTEIHEKLPVETASPQIPSKVETQESTTLKRAGVPPEPVPETEVGTKIPLESAMSRRLSNIKRRISNPTKDANVPPGPVPGTETGTLAPVESAMSRRISNIRRRISNPTKDADASPGPVPETEVGTTAPVESTLSKRLSNIRRRISNTKKDPEGPPESAPETEIHEKLPLESTLPRSPGKMETQESTPLKDADGPHEPTPETGIHEKLPLAPALLKMPIKTETQEVTPLEKANDPPEPVPEREGAPKVASESNLAKIPSKTKTSTPLKDADGLVERGPRELIHEKVPLEPALIKMSSKTETQEVTPLNKTEPVTETEAGPKLSMESNLAKMPSKIKTSTPLKGADDTATLPIKTEPQEPTQPTSIKEIDPDKAPPADITSPPKTEVKKSELEGPTEAKRPSSDLPEGTRKVDSAPPIGTAEKRSSIAKGTNNEAVSEHSIILGGKESTRAPAPIVTPLPKSGSTSIPAATPPSRPSLSSQRRSSHSGRRRSNSKTIRRLEKYFRPKRSGSRHSSVLRRLSLKIFVAEAHENNPIQSDGRGTDVKAISSGTSLSKSIVTQTPSQSSTVTKNSIGSRNESISLKTSSIDALDTVGHKNERTTTESEATSCSEYSLSSSLVSEKVKHQRTKRNEGTGSSGNSLLKRSSSKNLDSETSVGSSKKLDSSMNDSKSGLPKNYILQSLYSVPRNKLSGRQINAPRDSDQSFRKESSHLVIETLLKCTNDQKSSLWNRSEQSLPKQSWLNVLAPVTISTPHSKRSEATLDDGRNLYDISRLKSEARIVNDESSREHSYQENQSSEAPGKPPRERSRPWSGGKQKLSEENDKNNDDRVLQITKKNETRNDSEQKVGKKSLSDYFAAKTVDKAPSEISKTGSDNLQSLYRKFLKGSKAKDDSEDNLSGRASWRILHPESLGKLPRERSRPWSDSEQSLSGKSSKKTKLNTNSERNMSERSSLKNVDPEAFSELPRVTSRPWSDSEQNLSKKSSRNLKLRINSEQSSTEKSSVKAHVAVISDTTPRSNTSKTGDDSEQSNKPKRSFLKNLLPVAILKRSSKKNTPRSDSQHSFLRRSSSKTLVAKTLSNPLDNGIKTGSDSVKKLSQSPSFESHLTEGETIEISPGTNGRATDDSEQGLPKTSSLEKVVQMSAVESPGKFNESDGPIEQTAANGLNESVSRKSLRVRKSVHIAELSSGTCTQTLTTSALHPNSRSSTGVGTTVSFTLPNPTILVAQTKRDHQQCSYMTEVTEGTMFPRNKITVVGVGSVGSACAMSLLHKNVTREIMFYDYLASPRLLAETIDFQQASLYLGNPNVHCTNVPKDTAKSRIVIIAGGITMKNGLNNVDVIQANVQSMKGYIKELAMYSPDAVFLVITQPVDIMTWVTWRMTGLPLNQVVGSGTNFDSARFRDLLAKKLGLAPASVYGWIIGEHGEHSVPVWSSVNVAGVMLRELTGNNLAEDWSDIHSAVVKSSSDVNNIKGYSEWAIGLSCTELCEVIIDNKQSVHSVSTLARGYHGISSEVFLSLPCVLGENGVKSIINQRLISMEEQLFRKSATYVLEVQEACQLNLPPGKTTKLPEETEQYLSKSLSESKLKSQSK